MSNKRLGIVITGVIGAICLIISVISAVVAVVSPPDWLGAAADGIAVMTAVAILGVIGFIVFVILRSRSRE